MPGQSACGSTQHSAEGKQSSLLSLFLEKRQQDLPLRVKVMTGYQAEIEHHALSVGEVYDFYCLKQTKVVKVENYLQHTYYIPLNSAVQVSIPYQGSLNADGFTVSDLMSCSKPPLLMKAVNSYQCSSPKHSVEEDEVFVVSSFETLSQFLEVFSITHQVAKKLKTDCTTSFTTNVSLYMTDVVKHLTKCFPLRAVLYFDQNCSLFNALTANKVTLLKHGTRSTVVASYQREPDDVSGGSMLEIPIETDVSVSALCLDEHEKKALCTLTQNVIKNFDCLQVDVLSANGVTMRLVQKGHERMEYILIWWCHHHLSHLMQHHKLMRMKRMFMTTLLWTEK